MKNSRAKHAYVNGIDVYFEEYKSESEQSAPVIILLHGFLSSSFSFRKLIPLLENDFHVISIDIPPFGKSGKSRKFRYSYDNMAKTVIDLLDHLSVDHIYAAGHSMGGQIVMNMMLQRPDIIKKAVLLGSSGYLPKAKIPFIIASYIPFFDRYVKHYLGKTGVMGNLKNVVFDRALIDEMMVDGYTEPFNNNDIYHALRLMLRHREGDLPKDLIESIDTPCLLLWGKHDRIVPLSIGKQLANDLPNSKLIILQNAGHLLPEELPNEVYNEIHTYLINDWEGEHS